MNYEEFLRGKERAAGACGFEWPRERMNPRMFEWQKDIVSWALKKGRAALFEDCGNGKTIQQLEFCRAVCAHTGMPTLIVAPLTVGEQTKREAEKFGYAATLCRTQKDVRPGINITNYEMLEHFEAAAFGGVVLDEFYPAFEQGPEADYYQEMLDKQLREAYGDEIREGFYGFHERYEIFKKFDYQSGRWK